MFSFLVVKPESKGNQSREELLGERLQEELSVREQECKDLGRQSF